MTQAQLARKLNRLASFQQEAATSRARGAFGGFSPLSSGEQIDPRALLAEEQDRRRENLAERLLEIGLEAVNPRDFTNTSTVEEEGTVATCTVKEWFEALAEAARAAATVLYPEIPAEVEMSDVPAEPLVPPPAEAFEGARSVAPEP